MKKYLTTFITVVLLFFIKSECCGQASSERFVNWLHEDPLSIAADFKQKQLFTVASLGAGITMLSLNDAMVSQNTRGQYKSSVYLNMANKVGDWRIVTPASAGVFGISLLTDNKKFQDVAFTSLQSLLMTKLTVNAGKFLFARSRPSSGEGPYDLNFAELGATSFPSGHTAAAFAVITPWVMYYPGPVTYSLIAIPVGTAVARVAKGRHWLSDVTAGAAIGVAVSHYLAKKHLDLQSERIQIFPSAGMNNLSLTVNFSF